MELYTLKINVNKQRLSFGENKPEIFSGDQSIDFVEFTFEDAMWNFPDIWAIFSRFKGTSYQVALEDNKVMIPAEVMQKKGYVYIGLMATDGENVQTSNVLQYSIGQGATNVDAITPSASIYEQFLADLDAYKTAVADLDNIESRITTAGTTLTNLEGSISDAENDIQTVQGDIETIQSDIEDIQTAIEQNNVVTEEGVQAMIDEALTAFNITAGGSVQVRNIQAGTVYFPANANALQTVSVTFNREFENVPKVTLTPITAGPRSCDVSVTSITTTGFTACFIRSDNYPTNVNYIAIDA